MQIGFNPAFATNRNNVANNVSFTAKRKSQSSVSSYVNTDRMVDSFVKLAKVDTGSNEALAETRTPSTDGQKTLAKMLAEELKKLELAEVEIDEHSIVTATLKGNIGENSPVIGLLAHMDTSPAVPTSNVNPKIHNYKGGDIKLAEGTVISASDLKDCLGKKVITSDGKTLLGADDKAGIAEILEAVRVFKEHPELKHPEIRIAFTPDEEVGAGIAKFDIKRFRADVAYTVDGDLPSLIEDETFNAFNPEITIKGKNIHPGHAYKKMVNSANIASEFIGQLPKDQAPATTKGKQGFFHVLSINGNESETKISMLVRDFDFEEAQKKVAFLEKLAKKLQKANKGSIITIKPNERYRNMKEKISELPEVVSFARMGISRSGLQPKTKSIRGGTDGSQLSLRGLLTPNLGAGGRNFHSKNEFVPVEDMKRCTENIINTLIVWAENSAKVMPKILARRGRL